MKQNGGTGGSPQRASAIAFVSGTGREQPKFTDKPLGYSFFPKELFPVPGSWAKKLGNLVSYHRHDAGGHFAVSRIVMHSYLVEQF